MFELFGAVFWILAAVTAIIVICFVANDSCVKALFALIAFGVIVHMGTSANLVEYAILHIKELFVNAFLYAVAGTLLYGAKLYIDGLEIRSKWHSHIKNGGKAADFYVPEYDRFTSGGGTWIVYWPVSVLIWALGDLMKNIGEFLKKYLLQAYGYIYSRTIGGIATEVKAARLKEKYRE